MSSATITEPPPRQRPRPALGRTLLGAAAVLFGLATLFEGGHVLFGGPEARAAAGKVVPFVLVFNFSAAFAYVLGGAATLLSRPIAIWVARALALTTLLVFAAFAAHVFSGGAHETRTIAAMTLRSAFWVTQALLLPRFLDRGRHA